MPNALYAQGWNPTNLAPAPMQPAQMPTMGQPGFYSNPLYAYHDPSTTTNSLFQKGIDTAAPAVGGMGAGYQSILDTIRKQQDYATNVGVNNATSLAARRGLTGSSIEQFGVNQATEAASRAAQDASSNVLLQNESAQNQLRQLQAQLYGSRAQSLAGLGSDELTSLRNADYSQQYLQLQQQLGQQGLDLSRQNIDANRDIAHQNARNSLLTSGASILAPYLFGGGGGSGGAGFLSSLFGGGAGAGAGTMTAGAFNTAAPSGMAYSTMMPGGMGAVGTPGMYAGGGGFGAGVGSFAAAHPLAAGAAAGYGSMVLDHALKGTFNKTLGQSAGAAGRFLFNPIGSQLNFAKDALKSPGNAVKNVANKVTSAVSSVFPF